MFALPVRGLIYNAVFNQEGYFPTLFFAFSPPSAKHDLYLRRRIMAKNLENLRSLIVAVARKVSRQFFMDISQFFSHNAGLDEIFISVKLNY